MLIDHYNYNRLCQYVQGISSQVSSITQALEGAIRNHLFSNLILIQQVQKKIRNQDFGVKITYVRVTRAIRSIWKMRIILRIISNQKIRLRFLHSSHSQKFCLALLLFFINILLFSRQLSFSQLMVKFQSISIALMLDHQFFFPFRLAILSNYFSILIQHIAVAFLWLVMERFYLIYLIILLILAKICKFTRFIHFWKYLLVLVINDFLIHYLQCIIPQLLG